MEPSKRRRPVEGRIGSVDLARKIGLEPQHSIGVRLLGPLGSAVPHPKALSERQAGTPRASCRRG